MKVSKQKKKEKEISARKKIHAKKIYQLTLILLQLPSRI